ncbi:MAG TPA: hypothetical protein VK559_04810 [Ferruginibacter sp.]|nr:hypothetical protein [Ferruginibacter sp.]
MKKITLLTLVCMLCCSISEAQFYKTITPSNPFADSLTKAVTDFKFDYKNIEGTNLPAQTQTDVRVYNSKVTLPGASHCVIYRFNSRVDTTSSWQAIMYEGDDFDAALAEYKSLFRLVKHSSIKWVDKSYLNFVGDLEMPKDNVNFAISTLRLEAMDEQYAQFVAQVELTNAGGAYEVHLNLQNKGNDALADQ